MMPQRQGKQVSHDEPNNAYRARDDSYHLVSCHGMRKRQQRAGRVRHSAGHRAGAVGAVNKQHWDKVKKNL